jgi:hypothetical protein
LIVASTLLLAAAGSGADWRPFDLRKRGWGESPAYYDAASLERREGGRVRVRVFWTFHYSGLPDQRSRERLEIDCRQGRSRRIGGIIEAVPPRAGPRGVLRRTRFAPIMPDSLDEALRPIVCPPGGA